LWQQIISGGLLVRIVVDGPPGAGKSTFAQQLGAALGIEVIHLGAIVWRPNWIAVPRAEWETILQQRLDLKDWIFEGNYPEDLAVHLVQADLLIYLDLPLSLCLWRAISRQFRYFGRSRPGMPVGFPESLDWAEIRGVWQYFQEQRPLFLEAMRRHSAGKTLKILKTPTAVREFLQQIQNTVQ
jgi:adenylate kinase family enzyme